MVPPRKKVEFCVCGKQCAYDECCGLYISGQAIPNTAEQLMRSRYTAYTQANIPYIQATMCESAAQNFDPYSAKKWAQSIKWKSLKIISTYAHPIDVNRYYVYFSAHYILNGRPEKLNEISEFKKIDNKWFYVSGENPAL